MVQLQPNNYDRGISGELQYRILLLASRNARRTNKNLRNKNFQRYEGPNYLRQQDGSYEVTSVIGNRLDGPTHTEVVPHWEIFPTREHDCSGDFVFGEFSQIRGHVEQNYLFDKAYEVLGEKFPLSGWSVQEYPDKYLFYYYDKTDPEAVIKMLEFPRR